MKTIFKIKTYHLYSVRGNMLNCAKCLIVKNCENVNSVWLVLIRIWFRNLVWAEFFLIEPLMFNPPKFYRDHLKLQHFSRSVFNRKIFDNFVITIFIALTAWWTCGTSRVLFILSRISIIFHKFSRGIEILTCSNLILIHFIENTSKILFGGSKIDNLAYLPSHILTLIECLISSYHWTSFNYHFSWTSMHACH